jgi:hypothetical protein
MPNPPASATAAANRGVANPPIGACCNGTEQPTNSVNRVLSIQALLLALGETGPATGGDFEPSPDFFLQLIDDS